MSGLRVDRLAGLQHRDELRESARAGLRLLGVLQAVEDRVAVLTAEPEEELLRLRAGGELTLEVVGNGDSALALVGRLPAAVRLRALDLGEACRAHPAGGDEALGLLAVDLRPPAPRLSRREPLEEVVLVERLALAVDPPEAERALEHPRVAHALDAGVLLGDLEPDARRGGVVRLQPLLPLAGGSEEDGRKAIAHARRRLADRVSASTKFPRLG